MWKVENFLWISGFSNFTRMPLWKSVFLSTFDVEKIILSEQGIPGFSPIHTPY